MKTNETNTEAVARRLDGEAVELTEAEEAMVAEIVAGEARVGAALDVAVPPGVLHRVSARMPRAMRARRRTLAIRTGLGAAAAVAAGVVVMIALGRPEGPKTPGITAGQYVTELVKTPDTPVDGDLIALAAEIAAVEQDLASSGPWTTENRLFYLETQIGDAEVNVPTSVWPAEWDELKDAF